MANVNTIKTRILNKYDLLANYTNFTPLKGEVCIAVVGETTTDNKGLKGDTSANKIPIVGIKVGNGETPFNKLPWIQAVAGDVSTFIKGIVDEAKFNELVNALIANANLATKDALEGVDKRLQTAEGKITDLEAVVLTGDNSNDNLRAAISAALTEAKGHAETQAGNALTQAKNYTDTRETAILSAAAETAQGKVDALANGTVQGHTDAIAGINAKIGEVAYTGASLTAAIKNLQDSIGSSGSIGSQVADLSGRVDTLEGTVGDASSGLVKDVTDLKTAITDSGSLGSRVKTLEGEMDVVQAATAGYDESKTIASDIKVAKDAASAAQSKADSNETKVNTLIGTNEADVGKSARDIAGLVISEALVGGGASFDSLQEIAAWLKDHPEDVGKINAAIQSVKANLGYTTDAEGKEVAPATVDARIAAAIVAENLSQYATDDELGSAIERIAALEVAVGEEGEGSVADRIADAKEELIGTAGDASTANTIYGAKKHAEEKAAAAQTAAETTAAADATAKANKALEDATTLINNEKARAEGEEGKLNDAIGSVNTRIDELNYSKPEGTEGFVTSVTQTKGQISATYKKVGVADLADEVFVFYCGNATGYADDMKTVTI